MAYVPDLSSHKIEWLPSTFTSLNVGYLDQSHPYPTGTVEDVLVNKLWEFCLSPMIKYRGYHYCMFCPRPYTTVIVRHEGKRIELGASELFILGKENSLYVVPDLIYHYIVDHRYLPPQEFLVALRESPAPDASEYQAIRNYRVQAMRNLMAGPGRTEKH